jgi:outer membrane protein assembly factor BamB
MISRWPIRTGPVVKGGAVFFAAGMWPSEGVYVYALDIATGKQVWQNDSSGEFCRRQPHGGSAAFTGVCPQGYAAATDELLIIPSGRATPAAFDIRTGELRYYQPYLNSVPYTSEGWGNRGNGGCYVIVSGSVFLNSSHSGGAPELDANIGEAGPKVGDGLVAYDLATGMRRRELSGKHRAVAAADVLYAAGNGKLIALKFSAWLADGRIPENTLWSVPCERTYAIAIAGDSILTGGSSQIVAFDRNTGAQRWSHPAASPVRGLSVTESGLLAASADGSVNSSAQK